MLDPKNEISHESEISKVQHFLFNDFINFKRFPIHYNLTTLSLKLAL